MHAVRILAAHDPVANVRDAAGSVQLGWGEVLAPEQPDPNFSLTRQRMEKIPGEQLLSGSRNYSTSDGWEYTEFVYSWAPGEWETDADSAEQTVRESVWDAYEAKIITELDTMTNAGWQPLQNVDASAIKLRTHSRVSSGRAVEQALSFIMSALFQDWYYTKTETGITYIEPVELSVRMRRKIA